MHLSYHRAYRATALQSPGTGGCQKLGCIFFGVTSFLLLFLLRLLGRTGLLADLLPSFAVEIMPGIQSFNSYLLSFHLPASALVTNSLFDWGEVHLSV